MFGEQKFTVTEAHIKLLQKATVWWFNAENGAPAIDPKRPYGNSCIYPDIAKVVNIPTNKDEEYTEEEQIYMEKIHRETQIALEIFLRTGSMIPGTYIKKGYSEPWIKVSE